MTRREQINEEISKLIDEVCDICERTLIERAEGGFLKTTENYRRIKQLHKRYNALRKERDKLND